MKIGIFLGKKQAAWLEQFKLVAEYVLFFFFFSFSFFLLSR